MARRLTTQQKLLRHLARKAGKRTLQALLNMRYPVFDEDEAYWADVARMRAIEAGRYALKALGRAG